MRLVASRKGGGGEGRLQKLEMIFFAAETSTRDDFCVALSGIAARDLLLRFLRSFFCRGRLNLCRKKMVGETLSEGTKGAML